MDHYQTHKDAIYAAHATGTLSGLIAGVKAANTLLIQQIAPDDIQSDNLKLPETVQAKIALVDGSVMDKYQEHKESVFKACMSGDEDVMIAETAAADVKLFQKFEADTAVMYDSLEQQKLLMPTILYDYETKTHPVEQRYLMIHDFFVYYMDTVCNSEQYQELCEETPRWLGGVYTNGFTNTWDKEEKPYLKTLPFDKRKNYYKL